MVTVCWEQLWKSLVVYCLGAFIPFSCTDLLSSGYCETTYTVREVSVLLWGILCPAWETCYAFISSKTLHMWDLFLHFWFSLEAFHRAPGAFSLWICEVKCGHSTTWILQLRTLDLIYILHTVCSFWPKWLGVAWLPPGSKVLPCAMFSLTASVEWETSSVWLSIEISKIDGFMYPP